MGGSVCRGALRNKADLGRDLPYADRFGAWSGQAGTAFPTELARTGRPDRTRRSQHVRTARGRGLKNADTDIPLRIHRRSGADRRCRMAGSPFRQQSHRCQYPTRADAAAGRDRCRSGRRPPAPGAGPARQCRASPDDRRSERHRGRTQYRARDARSGNGAAPGGGGEQPPRIAPLPDAAWSEEAARADARSTDAFDHVEPQMPEPPPRPSRPNFADELRRPAPPPMPERRSDPLTGFAPELLGARAEPAPPRLPRTEPMMPRPQRASEPPKAPLREVPSREAPPS